MVDSALYVGGHRDRSVSIDTATPPDQRDHFVWIGLLEPSEELLRQVQARFGLHDLAVEDAHRAHQRPKLEVYGQSLFVVLRTAELKAGKVECGETHVFIGHGYVITVRHGASSSYAEVRKRCETIPRMLGKGIDFVLYSIIDFVVDNYFPIVETLEQEVEETAADVMTAAFSPEKIARIYEIRRELQVLRRSVQPLIDMTGRLARVEVPLIDEDLKPYFRDVQDHTTRLSERIENLRELLASALEANLLIVSIRQNEVMKKLAGWAAILAVPTAIAGIYGMNFEHMPELRWTYGYPAVIATILVVCAWLYMRFKRSGWL
ncbi:magnesium transporter [Skermanella stibiiresistens SB22]|uniref:Magnesium transport protein CorA n=1 Tax=Skermanella stibiiresistens SB22 TaxID=1385369 RepID=W9H9E9_9PROT|nr:magnesium transporter [Skermanella stibiiresistens SB22]